MENRSYAAIAVTFLILFAGGAAYLFYWLQAGDPAARPYRLVSEVPVSGLEPQANVTYQGLVIGHVSSMRLDPADPDRVLVDIRVRRDAPVLESMHAELATQGITGLAHVRLVKPPHGSDVPLETSADRPATLPLRQSRLQTLMMSAEDIAERIERVSQQLALLTAAENRRALVAMIGAIEGAASRIEEAADNLAPAIERLPAAVESARGAFEEAQALLRQARGTAETIQTTGEAGARLANQARTEILPELDATLERIADAARRLEALAGRLERQGGSLLFGPAPPPPGPGERGFEPPSEARPP